MHWVLGQKKKRKKNCLCSCRDFFPFWNLWMCCNDKRNWDTPFSVQDHYWKPTFFSPSKAAQKILDLVPDLVVLDEHNFTKVVCGRRSYPQVSSYTPPWINSETYTPFISAVFLSLLEYWFSSTEHSPPMHIAWVTITLGNRVTLATGHQFLFEVY